MNSVDRITDRPDMTSAVYRGYKASTQTDKQTNAIAHAGILLVIRAQNYNAFLILRSANSPLKINNSFFSDSFDFSMF